MARFAIIDNNNKVITIVGSDTIDGAEYIFPNHKIVRITEDNPCGQDYSYNEKYNKFVPEGYVYNAIKNVFMTQTEMEAY